MGGPPVLCLTPLHPGFPWLIQVRWGGFRGGTGADQFCVTVALRFAQLHVQERNAFEYSSKGVCSFHLSSVNIAMTVFPGQGLVVKPPYTRGEHK